MAAVEFERNDEMTETLSVVIPVYNAENYIRRAIDSVLSQTWRVYEIVCGRWFNGREPVHFK